MSDSKPPATPDAQDAAPTTPQAGWDGARTQALPDGPTEAKTIANEPAAPATLPTVAPPAPATLDAAAPPPTLATAQVEGAAPAPPLAPTVRAEKGGKGVVPTVMQDGTDQYGPSTNAPNTSAVTRGTGIFGRTLRTRLNGTLPEDTQQLDLKLQTSRTSVLVDMAAAVTGTLPPGVTRRVEAQTTEGRYAINKPLAAGGMGAVLHITDHDFARPAAMKVIHGKYARNPEALERFLAEAQVTAQLEHPNIVPIHDLGVMEDGTLYFTMKLIDGLSLGKVVKELRSGNQDALKKWTLEEKILVFLKVLDGVGFANDKGVIHRDIKPDNIMIGAHGEVLVVDWGIAKVMGAADHSHPLVRQIETIRQEQALSHTIEGAAMGTIYYMPPEQALGELPKIDQRSDIYALGSTLYELLALKRCLPPGDLKELLVRTIEGKVIPLADVVPDIPIDLAAIVAKAMKLKREDRYASCAEFASDLRRFLAGQAVLARQRNLIERLGAWYGRNKLAINAGAAAVVVLAAAVGGTAWALKSRDAARAEAKLAEANDAFAKGSAESLRQAQVALGEAAGARPDDARIAELRGKVEQSLALAEQEEREARDRAAAEARAKALFAEAETLEREGKLEEARSKLNSAADVGMAGPAFTALRDRVVQALANADLIRQQQEAAQHKDAGDAAVAKARALKPDDAALDPLLSDAEREYALSGQSGVAAPGIKDSLEQLVVLRRDLAAARKRAADTAAGEASLAQASAALAENKLAEAATLAAAASDRLAGRADAVRLLAEIGARQREAQAAAERAAAQAESAKQAETQLAVARAEVQRIAEARSRLLTAEASVRRLDQQLLGKPLGEKQPLFAAQGEARAARTAVTEHWQLAEAGAQGVVAALRDDRAHASVQAARSILADLYHGRLAEAKAEGRLPEIAAYTNLLKRYDDGRFSGELAGAALVGITGPAGAKLSIAVLARGADGRLVALGDARPVTVPAQNLELPAGRYQISGGDTVLSVVIPAGATTLAWPSVTPPSLPAGMAVRYVPAPPGGKPFLLGASEVTHEQYAAFIQDPAVWPAVLASYEARANAQEAGRPLPPLALVPRQGGALWAEQGGEDGLTGFAIPKAMASLPVNNVSRIDAEAFCAWLAKKTGRPVRLPSAVEWRFAADGGDAERIYPWGDAFDPGFCVTVYDSPKDRLTALPVLAKPTDVGPFGHRDLAGNLHEWLSDRGGRIGGLAAGGSYACEQAREFTTAATVSAEPDGTYPPIGFRILVEIP